MKNLLLIWLCLIIFFIAVSCQKKNTEETQQQEDHQNIQFNDDTLKIDGFMSTNEYETILDMYKEIVNIHKLYNPDESYEKYGDKFSKKWYKEIFNATLIGNVSNNSYGYAYSDLNGDSKLELILMLEDYTIIAIFSIVDGTPFMVSDFYSKKTCYIDSNKMICISGNNGADAWGYSEYMLSSDGTKLDILFEYGSEGYDSVNNKNIYYMISQKEKEYISDQRFSELFAAKPYLSVTEAAEKTEESAQLIFVSL